MTPSSGDPIAVTIAPPATEEQPALQLDVEDTRMNV
jgi:hypothetical protein